MRILITGINGFVGSILKQHLQDAGFDDIIGLDIDSHDAMTHDIDITDFDAVERAINIISPDCIFHLAAISKVDFKNPYQLYRINTSGTLNLLNAAIRLPRLPRFLLISSSQVYGSVEKSSQLISEKNPVNPINHYGASKAAAEAIAMGCHHESGLPLVIVRPFNHIGRGQNPHFVVPKIIQSFKHRDASIELGTLSVTRDFLDVRDVVDLYISIMNQFPNGQVFNVCSGQGTIISDIITRLQHITGHIVTIEATGRFVRKVEIDHAIGDNRKVAAAFGWQPRYALEDTLRWILSE